MGEIDVPARVIGRRYLCEKPLDPDATILCNLEVEREQGTRLLSSPPLYPHRCPRGHKTNLPNTYPHYAVVIEPIPDAINAAKPWWSRRRS